MQSVVLSVTNYSSFYSRTSRMKTFRDEMISRGWWLRPGVKTPATHLLLDGGRLCVPDDHAGTFLNLYFNSILRGESLSVVELKTPIFKLFFDIDARSKDLDMPFDAVFRSIYAAVHEFWVLDAPTRMIICAAPPKQHDDTEWKLGYHVIFPSIFVNAPIALAFRDVILEKLDADHPGTCLNSWTDAIDPCVFKANGLRIIYSGKGPNETRAYQPYASIESGDATIETIPDAPTPQDRRAFVHECSLRTFHETLSACAGGQDTIADQPRIHSAGGIVIGRTVALDVYADVLPKVHETLPAQYAQQRFVGVFKTDKAVMLRSSSRFCQNVGREHRTSTVYFCITRRGVCQKCYCRKEDHGCDSYSSEYYPLDESVINAFVPPKSKFLVDEEEAMTRKLPSKKKSTGSLDSLLKRSRFLHQPVKKSRKK